jgi:uncharacterized protein (DUF1800 family)
MSLLSSSPIATLRGRFTERHATRLLWRAGFGPRPGEARRLAARGLEGAVASLTRPAGPARLIGRPPHAAHGRPLDPVNVWGDDHCWWLDRMVRSDQPLVERMTLVWHGWLTSSVAAATAKLMLAQNATIRAHALGNFSDLLAEMTSDPAMLLWLSGVENSKYSPNENYARELMELFTLGADRGYSQDDVHNQARALTGFTATWTVGGGPHGFRLDPDLHDDGVKTIFGQRGNFDWRDSCRLCVEHPLHASFLVPKLWGYFVAEPIPAGVARALERVYVASGHEICPVMEAILRHPLFYEGASMVTPPVVFCAGMLRALGHTITTDDWGWIADLTGQKLFEPPNVAGWDYTRWLDTSRWAGRLTAVNYALADSVLDTNAKHYPVHEQPGGALAAALAHWGNPELSSEARGSLLAFSRRAQRKIRADWEAVSYRILRQNALRALVPMTPDWQTC